MVALFNDPFLKGRIAMRGGTVLHKVHLEPASRYEPPRRWHGSPTYSAAAEVRPSIQ